MTEPSCSTPQCPPTHTHTHRGSLREQIRRLRLTRAFCPLSNPHPSCTPPFPHIYLSVSIQRSIIPPTRRSVSETFVIHLLLPAQRIWPPLITLSDNLITLIIDFTFKKVTCAVGWVAVPVNHNNQIAVRANNRLANAIKTN